MARVRIAADVDADLRRRVKVAAASADKSVSEWIEEAVRRELEREEKQEYYPSEGSKPKGSKNPPRSGRSVAEAVIEDRR
ncbi:MAG: hypothetical protein IRY88_17905 [Rubrobacteraceae bacterium]|nr:hypothetical protein [Rubrobacteraceae bacterium]